MLTMYQVSSGEVCLSVVGDVLDHEVVARVAAATPAAAWRQADIDAYKERNYGNYRRAIKGFHPHVCGREHAGARLQPNGRTDRRSAEERAVGASRACC